MMPKKRTFISIGNKKLLEGVSASITFQPHATCYEFVQDYLQNNNYSFDYISEEDKQYCIDNDILIEVSWYPDTPVGHCTVVGSELNKILNFINEDKN